MEFSVDANMSFHDAEILEKKATAFCERHGLDTVDEIDYCGDPWEEKTQEMNRLRRLWEVIVRRKFGSPHYIHTSDPNSPTAGHFGKYL